MPKGERSAWKADRHHQKTAQRSRVSRSCLDAHRASPSAGRRRSPQLGSDLGGEEFEHLERGRPGESAELDLREEAIVAEQLAFVDDLVDNLAGAASPLNPADRGGALCLLAAPIRKVQPRDDATDIGGFERTRPRGLALRCR
jgi:hypothetical protein